MVILAKWLGVVPCGGVVAWRVVVAWLEASISGDTQLAHVEIGPRLALVESCPVDEVENLI